MQTFPLVRRNSEDASCVPELVSRQAALAAEATALAAGGRTCTYRELNARANQIAHHLQHLGVGRGAIVGCCLERSPEMVVALLGILKAGAAYLPLDPRHPPARLAAMLDDARAPVLLSHGAIAAKLVAGGARVLCLDTDAAALDARPTDDPAPTATADDLAYVIYTSGSTGTPKGVEITHGSLLHLVRWHQQAFAVSAADRATQFASPAFDATVWELWPNLTAGASVHFIDEDARVSPTALREALIAEAITIAFLPAALAEAVMMLEWPARAALRFLLTGADTVLRRPPPGLPFAVINNYGPTECTVVATSGRITPAAGAGARPSIGQPIGETEVYILDEQLRQVPRGAVGRLHLGGPGLARGYHRRPDLTAARFIPHPWRAEPGARIYDTGDFARLLSSGELEFLGRADTQVKLRGQRIDLDEIACAICRHEGIQTAAVGVDRAGERLAAYVVEAAGTRVTATSLRAMLEAQLPYYMVPASFVRLAALPLGPNGKLDRAALQVADGANALEEEVASAPRTPLEKQLAAIMADTLEVEAVGANDNFFMLGGHSFLGARLIARLSGELGRTVSLRTLFEAPTVALLARALEGR